MNKHHKLGPSGHIDSFTRDNLPPKELWPEFKLNEFSYPDFINIGYELTDAIVEKGLGDHIALIGGGRKRTYKELSEWSSQLAHVLKDDFGLVPGNRILIRGPNTPAMVACWLAATKAGAVVVNTMPMLRANEISRIVDKAEVSIALCDFRLLDEILKSATDSQFLKRIITFDGTHSLMGELDERAKLKPKSFEAIKTGRDDVALLGFTSGTTGKPKATMHFHRDLLIIADGYAKDVLQVTPEDVFVGSPPLAFTFGLGGLAVFPLRFGATATLLEKVGPNEIIDVIENYKATICFTAPTAYRSMLSLIDEGADLSSLRVAVSAGETLPPSVFNDWVEKTKIPIIDGIGATEMLHIFISNKLDDYSPGSTGKPIRGYEACILDDKGCRVDTNIVGSLAVKGPTGCRYLNDNRQAQYVTDEWNITGDSFLIDDNGYFHFVARNDDMIISSGYNIAGYEVESALLSHSAVAECAVIGIPDTERGSIVEAHIVLEDNKMGDTALIKELQEHVKNTIAPFKYPRSIKFCSSLPKTITGKIQRFKLRGSL